MEALHNNIIRIACKNPTISGGIVLPIPKTNTVRVHKVYLGPLHYQLYRISRNSPFTAPYPVYSSLPGRAATKGKPSNKRTIAVPPMVHPQIKDFIQVYEDYRVGGNYDAPVFNNFTVDRPYEIPFPEPHWTVPLEQMDGDWIEELEMMSSLNDYTDL